MFRSSFDESNMKIEDIICDIHALYNNDKTEKHVSGSVTSINLNIHALRQKAGFEKSQVINRDKWLSRISLQSTMIALSQAIVTWQQKSSENIVTIEEMAILCDLLLETITSFNVSCNNKLLNELLSKLAAIDVNSVSFKTFRKAIQEASDERYFIATRPKVLKPDTIYQIFHHQKLILRNSQELMFHEKMDGQQQANSWIVELCSEHRQLYQEICNHLIGRNSSVLSIFVDQVRLLSSNFFLLYLPEEQPFIMFYEASIKMGTSPLENGLSLIPKAIEELWQVSLIRPSSLPKLLYHFPELSNWITSYCLSNSIAQRLCLQLCRSPFKNDS